MEQDFRTVTTALSTATTYSLVSAEVTNTVPCSQNEERQQF
jgi:hypothetical protein